MARNIIRIDIPRDARDRYQELVYQRGMTQIIATDRLVEWFSHQHPGVQGAILSQYPKAIEADVAQLLLNRMKSQQVR